MPSSSPPSKLDIVNPLHHEGKGQGRSLEDLLRHHRRSSIPFIDRKPAVRFRRSIDLRKRSIAGPHDPIDESNSKSILKKSHHPILVDAYDRGGIRGRSDENITGTNDDLENCRYRTEIITGKIAMAERAGRGSIDVLTFPTSTRRVEALSRFQGCMTISTCTVGLYTSSDEFLRIRKINVGSQSSPFTELYALIDMAHSMSLEAKALYYTAKRFLAISKRRFNEWEELLKKNIDYRIEQGKVNYPIYSNKKVPESVTLFEDALEDMVKLNYGQLDGYIRACRSFPEGNIMLHCDLFDPPGKSVDSISFQDSQSDVQLEVIKCVTAHGRDLMFSSHNFLHQALELLLEKEIDESFGIIQTKMNCLEYDDQFDPLCALELKNAFGEIAARKAELLNAAEQILKHCKWLRSFSSKFYKYTRRSIKGSNFCSWLFCCEIGTSQKNLLQLLGIVSVEDLTVLMPLTLDIAQDIYHLDVFASHENEGAGESPNT